MSKLTHPARDLIAAARAGEAPPRDARNRVRARVMARVGAGVAVGSATVLGASSSAAKTALSGGLALKLLVAAGLAGAVAVAAVKGGLLQAPPPSDDRAAAPLVSEGARKAPVAPPRVTATPEPPPSVATALPGASAERALAASPRAASTAAVRAPSLPSTVRPSAEPPSLDDESALLARANAELVAGHPDRALAAYDEHNTQFKGGVLGEEERAGRILALCAAGRTAEARAEGQRFLAESPRSPMAARVQSSCAGEQHPVPSADSNGTPPVGARPSDGAKARSLP